MTHQIFAPLFGVSWSMSVLEATLPVQCYSDLRSIPSSITFQLCEVFYFVLSLCGDSEWFFLFELCCFPSKPIWNYPMVNASNMARSSAARKTFSVFPGIRLGILRIHCVLKFILLLVSIMRASTWTIENSPIQLELQDGRPVSKARAAPRLRAPPPSAQIPRKNGEGWGLRPNRTLADMMDFFLRSWITLHQIVRSGGRFWPITFVSSRASKRLIFPKPCSLVGIWGGGCCCLFVISFCNSRQFSWLGFLATFWPRSCCCWSTLSHI